MKRLIGATIAGFILAGAVVSADSRDKRKKHSGDDVTLVSARVVFGSRDVEVIRTHYAPRYRQLPPGLAKKYARTGQLPPGWQKKVEPLPAELERTLHPLPKGYRRGVIDAHAVIYDSSGAIIDVAVLF